MTLFYLIFCNSCSFVNKLSLFFALFNCHYNNLLLLIQVLWLLVIIITGHNYMYIVYEAFHSLWSINPVQFNLNNVHVHKKEMIICICAFALGPRSLNPASSYFFWKEKVLFSSCFYAYFRLSLIHVNPEVSDRALQGLEWVNSLPLFKKI